MGRNDEKPSRSISSDPTSDLAAPCPACGAELSPLPQAPGFCPQCGHHRPLPGRAWFDLLADPGSIAEFDPHLRSGDPLGFWTAAGSYAADLTRVREKSGEQESVVCAEAGIDGIPLVVVALSFAHFGGSIGAGAGEKIARAFERATALRRPILVVTASGGARMQEGMIALLQLPKIVLTAREHAGAGLISIAVLTSPTTGGVYVSFSALAGVVLAESGATIGFAGPRVAEQTTGRPLPTGSHTAEFAAGRGLVDAVVPRPHVRRVIQRLLAALQPGEAPSTKPVCPPPSAEGDGWSRLERVRNKRRPTGSDFEGSFVRPFFELRGDRQGGDDRALMAGFGAVAGRPVLLLAQDRNRGGRQGRMGPNGYRKALRALDLGARLGLPLVSVIDTPGADPGSESEGGGLAGAIGSCLAAVLVYPHPTLAIVAGEGGSGGALCLAACDRVIAWENAVFSVTSPEGAAAILFRDASRAPEVAGPLRIGAPDLLELGAFDRLVAEPNGDAATAPDQAIARIAAVAAEELELLTAEATEARLTRRRERYRHPRSERLEEN